MEQKKARQRRAFCFSVLAVFFTLTLVHSPLPGHEYGGSSLQATILLLLLLLRQSGKTASFLDIVLFQKYLNILGTQYLAH